MVVEERNFTIHEAQAERMAEAVPPHQPARLVMPVWVRIARPWLLGCMVPPGRVFARASTRKSIGGKNAQGAVCNPPCQGAGRVRVQPFHVFFFYSFVSNATIERFFLRCSCRVGLHSRLFHGVHGLPRTIFPRLLSLPMSIAAFVAASWYQRGQAIECGKNPAKLIIVEYSEHRRRIQMLLQPAERRQPLHVRFPVDVALLLSSVWVP